MIVSAHQPHFLPWLGYLDKIICSDVFVVMDDLQYEAQNFQNRNRIKMSGGAGWVTVPLVKGSRDQRICDKLIRNEGRLERHGWQRRAWESIKNSYGKARYFDDYADELEVLLSRQWNRLIDLNLHVLELARRWFEIKVPIVTSSSLELQGTRSERLIDLCKKVGADTYLSGRGGSVDYLDTDAFTRTGYGVCWQSYQHPSYSQRFDRVGFVSHLGFIDLLLNCGPESRAILDGGRLLDARQEVR